MSFRVEVWDDLEAAGGTRKAIVGPLVEGSMTRSVDNNDSVDLTALRSTEWLPHAGLRKVLRIVDHTSGITEWRITQVGQKRGAEQGTVTLAAQSPLTDFGVGGVIRDASTGGQTWSNLGGIGLTPSQYLESFVVPTLEAQGSTFISVGTVDVTDPLDAAWERWTPLQLLQDIATRTATEIEHLRASSSSYTIGLRTERGSTAATRLLRPGRNVEVLAWDRKLDHHKNVIVPAGQLVTGAIEAAGLAQNAWRVDEIDTVIDYDPGDDIDDLGGVFAGSSGRTYTDSAGVVQNASTTTLRDGHYINGTRVLLLEPLAGTNICRQSENFGTTWTASGTPTRSAAAHTASGVTLDLIGDDSAVASEFYEQTLTFTGNAVKAISLYMKVGTSVPTSGSDIRLLDATAGADRLLGNVAFVAGVPTVTMTTGTHLRTEACADGVYRFLFVTTSVTAANTHRIQVCPTRRNFGADTGNVYVGGVQVENNPYPTSYIRTTTASITRAAETLYFPVSALNTPAEFTAYVKHLESGSALTAAAGADVYLCHLGGSDASTPRFYVTYDATNAKFRALHHNGTASVQSAVGGNIAAVWGNTSEVLGILYSDGSVNAEHSVNAGAGTAGTQTAANALNTAWATTPPRLYLSCNPLGAGAGVIALQKLKLLREDRSFTYARQTDAALTLADIGGGEGPVAFADQITDLYLLKPNAELTQITSASTDHVIRVASAAGLSTGSHVEVRADSAGTHLLELTNPAQVTEYGRVVATYEDASLRGERNIIRNGLWPEWDALPDVLGCVASSSQNGSSLTVDGLTASATIKAGDRLHRSAALQTPNDLRVTVDTVATTSGRATLTLSSTQGSFTSTEALWLYRQGSTRAPTAYTYDSEVFASICVGRRTASVTANATGVSAGANNSGSSSPVFNISGLAANTEICAGDILKLDSTGLRFRIMGSVIATSSGAATVPLHVNAASTLTHAATTAGAGITIERPALTRDAEDNYAALQLQAQGISGALRPYIESPAITVRYDSTLPVLWGKAAISYHALSSAEITSASTTYDPLKLTLWNVDSSAEISSVTESDLTLDALSVTETLLAIQAELSSDTRIALRLYPPVWQFTGPNVNVAPDPFVYVRWLQTTIGPDPEVPPIEGSYASRMWQWTNRKLETVSQDPDVFSIALKDLSAVTGYPSSDEALTLGGTVRMFDADLAIDSNVRIMQITHNIVDPTDARVVLATRPSLLTETGVQANSGARVFINVDVAGSTATEGSAGGGTGSPVSTAPNVTTSVGNVNLNAPNQMPPRQEGAYRAQAPSSGGSTGNITRTIYRKNGV